MKKEESLSKIAQLKESLMEAARSKELQANEFQELLQNKSKENEELCLNIMVLQEEIKIHGDTKSTLDLQIKSLSSNLQTLQLEQSVSDEKNAEILKQRDSLLSKLSLAESECKMYEENLKAHAYQREEEKKNFELELDTITKEKEEEKKKFCRQIK